MCGKPACTVRREGGPGTQPALPTPITRWPLRGPACPAAPGLAPQNHWGQTRPGERAAERAKAWAVTHPQQPAGLDATTELVVPSTARPDDTTQSARSLPPPPPTCQEEKSGMVQGKASQGNTLRLCPMGRQGSGLGRKAHYTLELWQQPRAATEGKWPREVLPSPEPGHKPHMRGLR